MSDIVQSERLSYSVGCLFAVLVFCHFPWTTSNGAAGIWQRPVTIADAIRMVRWPWGALWFSPDSKAFVVVLRKGNLDNNTNEYSLLLWQTDCIFRSGRPEVLLTMSSSSNRPAITDITWLANSETLVFLGENPGEFNQLYTFNIHSRVLKKLTDRPINKVGYSITPDGNRFAYIGEEPVTTIFDAKARKEGVIVSSQPLSDLIAEEKGGDGRFTGNNQLYLQSGITTRRVRTNHKLAVDVPPFSSPDGKYLIVRTFVASVPKSWEEYADPLLHEWALTTQPHGQSSWLQRYELINTSTGEGRTLLDAPVRPGWGSEVAWSPDGHSVVVSDTYLPLDGTTDEERKHRLSLSFAVEIEVPSGHVTKVSSEDLRLLEWNARTNNLVFLVGRLNWNSEPKASFRKQGDEWYKVPESYATPLHPEISVDEDLNVPPKLIAVDPATGRRVSLLDLNPQFGGLRFAKEEEIHWNARDGHEVKGGLYYPLDYVPGKKYPLVIQTHIFIPGHFFIDGPYTTAFAAQPLASKGIMVLQMDEIDGHYDEATPELMQQESAMLEAAIDHLNDRGYIDPNRIGIVGFSITGADVAYILTLFVVPVCRGIAYICSQRRILRIRRLVQLRKEYGTISRGYQRRASIWGGPPVVAKTIAWVQRG